MAGTARGAIFHFFHGRWVRAALGFEEIRVALVATEHVGMCRVRKYYITSFFDFKKNVTSVTFRAVFGHAEGFFAVVTSTT